MDKATVLFVAANPTSTTRLALDEEARLIEQKIRASEYRDAIDFRTRWAVQPDDLLQALNQDRPTIVHFSGHGTGANGIVLQSPTGAAALVGSDALGLLFRAVRGRIRVVVLNACWSEPQARALAESIDCVVGMTREIGDASARVFGASLYRAIGFGRSVQDAFDQGLAAIALQGQPEETTPHLYVRKGVDAKGVFVLPGERRSLRPWLAGGAIAAAGLAVGAAWMLGHHAPAEHGAITRTDVIDARPPVPVSDAAPQGNVTADHGIAAGGGVTIIGSHVDIGSGDAPDASTATRAP